jgi:hypothetical protein
MVPTDARRKTMNESWKGMTREQLYRLIENCSKNWLAMDGVWFQSVESRLGMDEAMKHDAAIWQRFTRIEARRAKDFLGLPDRSGLEGLEKALNLRMYANMCADSARMEDGALIYTLYDCRVQHARTSKGMPMHPCKSIGEIEYSGFAEVIDDRIRCECISCFPDVTDPGCSCSWRFTLEEHHA